jgi:hypothetical protein
MNILSRTYYRLKDMALYHLHPTKAMMYQDFYRSKPVTADGQSVAVWRAAKRHCFGLSGLTLQQPDPTKTPVFLNGGIYMHGTTEAPPQFGEEMKHLQKP